VYVFRVAAQGVVKGSGTEIGARILQQVDQVLERLVGRLLRAVVAKQAPVVAPDKVLGFRILVYELVEVGTLYIAVEILEEEPGYVLACCPLRRWGVPAAVIEGVVVAGLPCAASPAGC
jgi:hypothetical protein